MKIYDTYKQQLAHAAEEGISLFPVTDEEKAKFVAYFKHPEPKDAKGMRELAKYMGITFQESAWEVDGYEVWVGVFALTRILWAFCPGAPSLSVGQRWRLTLIG